MSLSLCPASSCLVKAADFCLAPDPSTILAPLVACGYISRFFLLLPFLDASHMFPINHLVPASEAGRRSWHLLLPPVLRRIPLSGCCFILPGWTRCCFLCALCPEELAPSLAHLVLPLVPHPAQLSRCVFSANCIQLCFGGLQPLCFSVPFTLDYPALISCPSSP